MLKGKKEEHHFIGKIKIKVEGPGNSICRAAFCREEECVRVFLAQGANPNTRNNKQQSALWISAIHIKHPPCVGKNTNQITISCL